MTPGARAALATLAGLLNGAAFVDLGPLALVANVPLLVALDGARTARGAALLGGAVGFVAGLHIYGVVDYGWLLFAGFAVYTGSQMVLYALAWRALWGRLGSAVDLALPALIWTLTEWIRTLGPLAMPASYVGCVADVEALRPWLALAPITGGIGVSALVALTQSVVYHGLFHRATHGRATLVAALVPALAWSYGARWPAPLGDDPVRVVGVQGGLPNSQYHAAQADPAAARDIIGTYETLTRAALASEPDLVVWPETAVRAPVLDEPGLSARLFPPTSSEVTLIAGLITRDAAGRRQNAAVAVHRGVEIDRYAKVRLVPQAEAHFARGAAWRPLQTPVGRVGALICLESVYPQAGRAMAAAGAELLVVLTNDAGFGWSPITRHMTNRAIVRAVETGRWLLRVGQSGISALIDPTGRVHARTALFEPTHLVGVMHRRSDQTPFVRWGDWWAWLSLGVLALIAFLARRARSVSA